MCNSDYGDTGWLGLAQIWITSQNHIVQGVTEMNDYYFSGACFNAFHGRDVHRTMFHGYCVAFKFHQRIPQNHDTGASRIDTNHRVCLRLHKIARKNR